MTKVHVLAIAAGLLLAVSGPSVAAKRTLQKSDTKSAVKSQSRATKSSGSAIRPFTRYPYNRDPYPYSRDPDPYAPGYTGPRVPDPAARWRIAPISNNLWIAPDLKITGSRMWG